MISVGVVSFLAAFPSHSQVSLNSEGYFEGPGLAFLAYHNTYIGGRQGGLQMLLNGARVLDAGTLFCRTADGKAISYYSDDGKEVGERAVDLPRLTVAIPGKFPALDLSYRLEVRAEGESFVVSARLDKPVDWQKVSECVLKFEIYPEAYFGKTYLGGGVSDWFHEKDLGRRVLIPEADQIVVAPEDPLLTLTFRAAHAKLSLCDERRDLKVSGYMVFASLPKNSTETEFSMTITPKLDPAWRRDPVIQVSQVGYHPAQQKVAVLELDGRTSETIPVELVHLNAEGALETVKTGMPVQWGPLFDYQYYTFDFSDVVAPGQYFLKYGKQQAGPFQIDPKVYREAWHPTMDTFFPVQMCHVKVRDFLVVWHGACHVDDALQVPAGNPGRDGYHQGPETESPFKADEHVPGLDWGGWHDAGDFDLPAGAAAGSVLWMALAQQEFHTDRDVTSVLRSERLVEMNVPDQKNDMLQQVAYGMEYLLGMYHALGHIGAGIIANNGPDYGRIGDPASITDGLVYDPSLGPEQRADGRSGKHDDRWVYTNRNTGGQYQFAQVAAMSAVLLKDQDPALARECLRAAQDAWAYEQSHEPTHFAVAYQPREDEFHSWELAAASELYLATGDKRYKERLLALIPNIEQMPARTFGFGNGFELVRALEKVRDRAFRKAVRKKAEEFSEAARAEFAMSPYGVDMHFDIWGNNWTVLQQTARLYFFIKQFPDLFTSEVLYHGLNYNFGCHPATNHSYVSDVGANSATVAFGFNRNDSTYIPGGVVSGASLIRPKFPEYRARPWDWYQTEYVIQGSAAYVFDVLAADHLLNRGKAAH